MLSVSNPHPRDAHISFDEPTHTYTVHGQSDYTSVTTWNHAHFQEFDEAKIIAKIMAGGRTLSDPQYKYFGQSADDIRRAWEDNRLRASAAGTDMHLQIELFYNAQVSRQEIQSRASDQVEFAYFLKFVDDFSAQFPLLRPFRTEWTVYYQEAKIAGSIDMLFEDTRDGSLWIYDWKRSKDMTFEPQWRGAPGAKTACIAHLPDTNFWHYALQLNVYRFIIEAKYGRSVSKMCLVKLHPDNLLQSYELFEVPPMDAEMQALFAERIAAVSANANATTTPRV